MIGGERTKLQVPHGRSPSMGRVTYKSPTLKIPNPVYRNTLWGKAQGKENRDFARLALPNFSSQISPSIVWGAFGTVVMKIRRAGLQPSISLRPPSFSSIAAISDGSLRLRADKAGRSIERMISKLSPLGWDHINITGDYVWSDTLEVDQEGFLPIRLAPT